ncbi:hypothetical protein EUX98_g5526 [Antrodiella citrinella]|uniref:HNH nuclease domain-containing protein n=1 Tax=Antrodiella citrinella TaxID=2447956 RepID=A0A4S4MR89_9APHY|nr:hypothetical protein EUX98_g5526 [Antrodiella citrinella]
MSESVPLPDRGLASQKFLGWSRDELTAYDKCFQCERATDLPDHIRFARIIGYLLILAPTARVRIEIAKWVNKCGEIDEDVYAVGEFIQTYLIRAFKKHRGRTPGPSRHPSEPEFEFTKEAIFDLLDAAPASHSTAKKQALIRDGYRCVVCGVWDRHVPKKKKTTPGFTVRTQCAHIVPESIFVGLNVNSLGSANSKADFSASMLAVLQCFGYDIEASNGPAIHSLPNVMTLQADVHDAFDCLELWFVATEVPHCYEIGTVPGTEPRELPPTVEFTSTYPDKFALPSPAMLSLHATCAQVAHMSGAAEYLDELDRKIEEVSVLLSDGGSAELLSHAILHLSNVVTVR